MSQLVIGLVAVLFVPALVWAAVVVGLLKVLRRRSISERPAPSGSFRS